MITIELLWESSETPEVAYQEFMLQTRKNETGLFCFFEGISGSDNPYYVPRIKHYISLYCPIRCNGRKNVLAVYKLISARKEYDNYKNDQQ